MLLLRRTDGDLIQAKIIQKSGRGQYGSVYKVSVNGEIMAAKLFADRDLAQHEHDVYQRIYETHRKQKKRVTRFSAFCDFCEQVSQEKQKKFVLLMDHMGVSLNDYIEKKKHADQKELLERLFRDCVRCIHDLHRCGYVHRDIKGQNFMVCGDKVKMIDFGFASSFRDGRNGGRHISFSTNCEVVGTLRYMSLNSHLGVAQGRRDDIESLVYLFFQYVHGSLPWKASSNDLQQIQQAALRSKLILDTQVVFGNEVPDAPLDIVCLLRIAKRTRFEQRPDYTLLMRSAQFQQQSDSGDSIIAAQK